MKKNNSSVILGTLALGAVAGLTASLCKKSNRIKLKKGLDSTLDLINKRFKKETIIPCNEVYTWTSTDEE